jgi:hypothetical protein
MRSDLVTYALRLLLCCQIAFMNENLARYSCWSLSPREESARSTISLTIICASYRIGCMIDSSSTSLPTAQHIHLNWMLYEVLHICFRTVISRHLLRCSPPLWAISIRLTSMDPARGQYLKHRPHVVHSVRTGCFAGYPTDHRFCYTQSSSQASSRERVCVEKTIFSEAVQQVGSITRMSSINKNSH